MKNKVKLLVTLTFLICSIQISKAQTKGGTSVPQNLYGEYLSAIGNDNPNYYKIKTAFENYWKSLDDKAKIENARTEKMYERWLHYWAPRMEGSDGDINKAIRLYTSTILNTKFSDGSNQRGCPPWTPLGPDSVYFKARNEGVGRITTAAFHNDFNGKYGYGVLPPSTDKNGNTLYAGSVTGGVFRTLNGGKNWTNLNTDNLYFCGATEIELSKINSTELYMSSGAGFEPANDGWHGVNGIYRSTDAGTTWNLCGAPFNLSQTQSAYRDFEIIPNAAYPNGEYLLGLLETGVYYSSNKGVSWNTSTIPNWRYNFSRGPFKLNWSINNVSKIYLSGWLYWGHGTGGRDADSMYYSSNGGLNWQLFDTIGLHGCNPNKLDLGIPISHKDSAYIESHTVTVSPTNANNIWVGVSVITYPKTSFQLTCTNNFIAGGNTFITQIKYLFFSSNGGATWKRMKFLDVNGVGGLKNIAGISVDPSSDAILYMNYTDGVSTGLMISKDSGKTWSDCPMSVKYHPDTRVLKTRSLKLNGVKRTIGLVGTDGGVNINWNLKDSFLVIDSWKNVTGRGLQVGQSYRHSSSQSSKNGRLLIFGGQDIGHSIRIGNQTNSWHHQGWVTGDGMDCESDFKDSTIFYAADGQNGGKIERGYFNPGFGATSWTNTNLKPIGEVTYWVAPLLLNPQNNKSTISAYLSIWKSKGQVPNGNPNNYIKLPVSSLTNQLITNVAMAKFDSNFIMGTIINADNSNTAFPNRRLFRTVNGGATWTWSGYNWDKFISEILIDPSNNKRVFVSLSGLNYAGTATKRVMKSEDNGLTWKNMSFGLPDVPANCLTIDPLCEKIYVGTDKGVYQASLLDTIWSRYGCGLPNTLVTDLDIASQKLRASTHGRGLWEVELPNCEPLPPKGSTGKSESKIQPTIPQVTMTLSPNPGNDLFNIEINSESNFKSVLTVINAKGEVIYSTQFEYVSNENNRITLDLSKESAGVYIVNITSQEGVKSIKLVKN